VDALSPIGLIAAPVFSSLRMGQQVCTSLSAYPRKQYNKTSLIRTNWVQTLVQISLSPNCKSATENVLREVTKWTSHFSIGNTFSFSTQIAYHKINSLAYYDVLKK
jgi:hypothetical protein